MCNSNRDSVCLGLGKFLSLASRNGLAGTLGPAFDVLGNVDMFGFDSIVGGGVLTVPVK